MTSTHEGRKERADEKAAPAFFFSYVLEFEDDGSFYVGSTNAPAARWTEHAVGVGAKATAGRKFTVRMAMPFLSRKEAEYNEKRTQEALDRGGPSNLEALLSLYDQMINMVRPPKTFSELREEEERYINKMSRVFHHSRSEMGSFGNRPPTTCGYKGPTGYFSTKDWDVLKKMARDEDYTGNIYGREVCRLCLEYAPA